LLILFYKILQPTKEISTCKTISRKGEASGNC